MPSISSLLLGILLLGRLDGQCLVEGCLSCRLSPTYCQVCNNLLKFVSDGNGHCVPQLGLENCSMSVVAGECLQCDPGFVLLGKICTTDHCSRYSADGQACLECKAGYYLRGKKCINMPFFAGVPHCSVFSSVTTCLHCEVGYHLTEPNLCEVNLPNCLRHTDHGCHTCAPNKFSTTPLIVDNPNTLWEILDEYTRYGVAGSSTKTCGSGSVANCAVYDTATTCAVCATGYYKDVNSQCVAVSPLIAQCVEYSSATVCSKCNPGFFFDGTICRANPGVNLIPNCLFYTSPSVCKRCLPNNFFNGSECGPILPVNIVPNCQYYSSSTQCELCLLGFYLSGNTCVAAKEIIPNCVKHAQSECLFCQAGFFVSGGACVAVSTPIDNCSRYSAETVCQECEPSFFLAAGECAPILIDQCNIHIEPGLCMYCNAGYISNGQCSPSTAITNCFANGAGSTCEICNETFMTAGDNRNICRPISQVVIPNCATYNTLTECAFCKPSFWLDSTTFECKPASPIANCLTLATATTCMFCNPGYFVTASGTCSVATGGTIARCRVYSAANRCLYCDKDYVPSMDQKTCLAGPWADSNCLYAKVNNYCLFCKEGFYTTDSGSCLPSFKEIPDCKQYDLNGNCVICKAGFYQSGPLCQPTSTSVANCFTQDSPSTCDLCQPGFFASGGVCQPLVTPHCAATISDNLCAFCEAGYRLEANVCITASPVVAHCVRQTSATVCGECEPGFFVSSGTCVARYTPGQCKHTASDTQCLICKPGFYPNAGVCQAASPSVNNCAEYASDQSCTTCWSAYYISGGACVPHSPAYVAKCAEYISLGQCKYCETGYFPSATKNVCNPVTTTVANCAFYAADGVCGVCAAGSALNPSGACFAKCQQADLTRCTRCAVDYFWNGTACQAMNPKIANCLEYSVMATCSLCAPGFRLTKDNVCEQNLPVPDLTCSYSDLMRCNLCQQGYYVKNGECVKVPAANEVFGCLVYDENMLCDVCHPAYGQLAKKAPCTLNAKLPPMLQFSTLSEALSALLP